MLNIEESFTGKYAFLQLGFRPFFSAAMGFGVLGIIAWALIYFSAWSLPAENYSPVTWHGHEMVFGYTLAVIAGFLLTAIRNWTGVQTLNGSPLLSLFLCWLLARILPFIVTKNALPLVAITDLLFNILLVAAVAYPIIKVKQWQNIIFPVLCFIIFISNLVFYLGLTGVFPQLMQTGLYTGFYILLGIIFLMGRRVIPFFIEKGVDEPFQARNFQWLDSSSLVLFILFVIADLINSSSLITASLAGLLFILHCIRLYGWYTKGIWSKTLLWILYLGYGWIATGFLLKALSISHGISVFLAIHSFAYGGIGMITIGMMTRVALGHTGRNVFDPPAILKLVFLSLLTGSVFRVIFPLLFNEYYGYWIGIAQALWITAFTVIFVIYVPMLIKARVDGRPG